MNVTLGTRPQVAATSAGLLAVKIAGSAARARLGMTLDKAETEILAAVALRLETEVAVLRGEETPDVEDESTYAFAGFALSAIDGTTSGSTQSDEDAAAALSNLAATLKSLSSGAHLAEADLSAIESVFRRTSQFASRGLSRSGERVDALPAYFNH